MTRGGVLQPSVMTRGGVAKPPVMPRGVEVGPHPWNCLRLRDISLIGSYCHNVVT